MIGFGVLVAIFSGSVLFGTPTETMMFRPDAVAGGEWWRLLTHPFVHVTWYHLLLDASAFFLLYYGLIEKQLSRRLLYVIAGAAGSLGLSWLAAPAITTQGLCGLSGIAHGLMAISAVEMMRANARATTEWRLGAFTFALVVGKAAWEAISGHVMFEFLYFRMVGDPITISHAGGIVGALLATLLLPRREAERKAEPR
jgi:rhomboid family GlyGly-CTERM serine protease